ncbi:secreted antigen 1 [Babesia divergens]|uniref:Secreted antigen 1 n=1 Tax=Babesia divergens TaxID=32595 RepID=A0AAD9G6H2_BABDI|nr:secreted antigen 1 [Babesia divergens]
MNSFKLLNALALCLFGLTFYAPSTAVCADAKAPTPFGDIGFVDDSDDEEEDAQQAPTYGTIQLKSGSYKPSNLATAVYFLDEFCTALSANLFHENITFKKFGSVKHICGKLATNLKVLTTNLSPLPTIQNPYKDTLKPEGVEGYLGWVEMNTPMVVESFKKILQESKGWIKEGSRDVNPTGISEYGFEVKGEKLYEFVKFRLSALIKNVMVYLEYIQKTLMEADVRCI